MSWFSVLLELNSISLEFCLSSPLSSQLHFRKNPERGYRIGYAVSDDLHSWIRKDQEAGIEYSSEGWDSQMMHYPHVFNLDNKWYMLYNGNDFGRYGFGLAELVEN